jgi:hypothetical protein
MARSNVHGVQLPMESTVFHRATLPKRQNPKPLDNHQSPIYSTQLHVNHKTTTTTEKYRETLSLISHLTEVLLEAMDNLLDNREASWCTQEARGAKRRMAAPSSRRRSAFPMACMPLLFSPAMTKRALFSPR